jgi:hypothetical protein
MAMNGYVLNASNIWAHAMKRSIAPGSKIPLDELYEQYGVKHDLSEGEEFVQWLRNVKLTDPKRWKIVYESGNGKIKEDMPAAEEEAKPAGKGQPDNVSGFVDNTKMNIEDVVGLSVRKGRDVIPKITDLKLLQYSLQEANKLAGKDSLCRVIRKRIKELQIAR